jgi:hypothetical protein
VVSMMDDVAARRRITSHVNRLEYGSILARLTRKCQSLVMCMSKKSG